MSQSKYLFSSLRIQIFVCYAEIFVQNHLTQWIMSKTRGCRRCLEDWFSAKTVFNFRHLFSILIFLNNKLLIGEGAKTWVKCTKIIVWKTNIWILSMEKTNIWILLLFANLFLRLFLDQTGCCMGTISSIQIFVFYACATLIWKRSKKT